MKYLIERMVTSSSIDNVASWAKQFIRASQYVSRNGGTANVTVNIEQHVVTE